MGEFCPGQVIEGIRIESSIVFPVNVVPGVYVRNARPLSFSIALGPIESDVEPFARLKIMALNNAVEREADRIEVG